MRKIGLILIAVAALALVPAISWAQITGTAHDLSGLGWGTDQICVFCHTPHNALAPQLIPLWNHAATTQTLHAVRKHQPERGARAARGRFESVPELPRRT